jgi:hypothetical protein
MPRKKHFSRTVTFLSTGLAAAALTAASLLAPSAANAASLPTTPTVGGAADPVHVSRSTAPGGAQLGQPRRLGSDKATQIHVVFTNKTAQTLNLTRAETDGTGVHWQNRPPQTLAPGAMGTASAYAAADAQIDLTYQGEQDQTDFVMTAQTPLVGHNQAVGGSYSPSYWVPATIGTGYNPTATFIMQPGGLFNSTGATEEYTVPYGTTQLAVKVTGGGTWNVGSLGQFSYGALVTGTLAVTPGETLVVGAGAGVNVYNSVAGGWGMTWNGDNYSGGNGGPIIDDNLNGGPGAGASVLADQTSGSVIAVAGGGGGGGVYGSGVCKDARGFGGDGGAGGWTGGNGQPYPGGGGQAGANTTTQGQDSASPTGNCSAGAGGGGAAGGLAGTDGTGGGGGAGSSAAPGLTGAAVTTGPEDPDADTAPSGSIEISAAS